MACCARWFSFAAALIGLVLASSTSYAVDIDWVTISNPGNAPDDTGFGSVSYEYMIGRTEVTNAQYASFLNSVAATDTYELYNTSMGVVSSLGGISRSGAPGAYTYATIDGRAEMPVTYVSFWDALRFSNWLHNGSPTGPQGAGTTETGAYTLDPIGIAENTITRNPDATIFLTSEDEWYKAAFFNPETMLYSNYPGGSDTPISCSSPTAAPNSANCDYAVRDLTIVGSYSGSASPYGTFDQAGNTWEWNESIYGTRNRGIRGGSLISTDPDVFSSGALAIASTGSEGLTGFRVAAIPEPSTAVLVGVGLAMSGFLRRRQ